MESTAQYEVNLEVFQGPLDLLFFLIKKKKIDIHDIPIATITREYLLYLEQKDMINLEREAEFLLYAALLIYIKSQMLLPREMDSGDEEDPRKALVDRLMDYQKIKAACTLLRKREDQNLPKWHRDFLPPMEESEEVVISEASLFDLAHLFFELLRKKEKENLLVISTEKMTVDEKIREISSYLKKHSFLDFLEYFSSQESIEEALIAFFALLEMIKTRTIIAVQESLFHTIKVWLYREKRA